MSFSSHGDSHSIPQLLIEGIQVHKYEWNISINDLDVTLRNADIPKLILHVNKTRNNTTPGHTESHVNILNSTIGHISVSGNYEVHIEGCIINITDKLYPQSIVTNRCNLTINNSIFYGTAELLRNQSNSTHVGGTIFAIHSKKVQIENTEFRNVRFSVSAIVIYQSYTIHIQRVHIENCSAPKGAGETWTRSLLEISNSYYLFMEECDIIPHYTNKGGMLAISGLQKVRVNKCNFSGTGYVGVYLMKIPHVYFDLCTFTNGNYALCGLVSSNSNVTITKCRFLDNVVVKRANALAMFGGTSYVHLVDSKIIRNSASTAIISVFAMSSLHIVNTSCLYNAAFMLVFCENCHLDINSSAFASNKASIISADNGSTITANDLHILDNAGQLRNFPLISNTYGKSTVFTNCLISNNSQEDMIFWLIQTEITVKNCTFKANKARFVVRLGGNRTSIFSNNTFDDNDASSLLSLSGFLSVTITNSHFIENNIQQTLLGATGGTSIFLSQSVFLRNNMTQSVSIFSGSKLIASDVVLRENSCYGQECALMYASKGSNSKMHNFTVLSNRLNHGYAVIAIETNTTYIIINSTIAENMLQHLKGGILYSTDSCNGTISATNISNDIATNTPTLSIAYSHLLVTRCTISTNRVIETKNSSFILVFSSVSNCYVQDNNLFRFIQQSNVIIRNTIFEENHFTKYDKSVILSLLFCGQNSKVTIKLCEFYNNSARGFGMIFHCSKSYIEVLRSSVWTMPSEDRVGIEAGSGVTLHDSSFRSVDTIYEDSNTPSLSFYSNGSYILLHNVSLNKLIGTYSNSGLMFLRTSKIHLAFTNLQLAGPDSSVSHAHLPSMFTFVNHQDTVVQKLLTFNSSFLFGTNQLVSSNENFSTEAKENRMISAVNLHEFRTGSTYIHIEETPYASCKYTWGHLCQHLRVMTKRTYLSGMPSNTAPWVNGRLRHSTGSKVA